MVLYHMDASVLPCGLLGVTIFFVLSGYLITGILIKEWNRTRTINLPHFWMNRVRRLVPAIVFMVLSVAVLTAIFAPDMLTRLREDIVAALFFFSNWWFIFQDLSYFEAMGSPSPVNHFWSLAIEEQFYLIFPPLLLLLFKNRVKKRTIQRGLMVVIVLSALEMFLLYDPAGDPSRVYYGTDTRAFSLLVGALFAFLFPQGRVLGRGARGFSRQQRRLVDIAGTVSFAAIIVFMALVSGYSPFLYSGGILIVSVLTAVLIVALVYPYSFMARLLSLSPLVWLGKLSYGIYLWHYPLLLLMNPRTFTGETPWFVYLGQMAVVVAVAAFSYYAVENPIRHGAIGRFVKELRSREGSAAQALGKRVVPLASAAMLVIGAVGVCVAVPPVATQGHTAEVSVGQALGKTGAKEPSWEVETIVALDPSDNPKAPPAQRARYTDFLLVGDSVTAAMADEGQGGYGTFHRYFPRAVLNAAVSRQLSTAREFYEAEVDAGWDGDIVIFEMGSNGVATEEQVGEMIDCVPPDKRVFLINVRTPFPLQDINNKLLKKMARERDNVSLIDWYSYSTDHDDWFDGDGTHLKPSGCEKYLDMVQSALVAHYEDEAARAEAQASGRKPMIERGPFIGAVEGKA
ncbi:MAG: acyltransferase [Eggerthellaceae bacterium]|nr:acyltransferase [Eggerthellaceae bacterium]